MARPKTASPKRVVTLRLRPELIARYEALGGSWRAHMEAALERFGLPSPNLAPPTPMRAEPEKLRRPPVPYGSRLKKR